MSGDELDDAITGAMTEAGLLNEDGSDPGTDDAIDDGGDADPIDDGDDAGDDASDDSDAGDAGDTASGDPDDPDASAGDKTAAGQDGKKTGDQDGQPPAGDTPVQREGKPKKRGRIPLPRHEEIIKNLRDEYEHAETGKLTKATKALESLKWAQDPEAYARHMALDLAEKDPERFVQLLIKEPRIARLIQLRGAETAIDKAASAKEPAKSKVGDRPGPNAVYKDPETGQETRYYDDKGMAAVHDWQEARAREIAQEAAQEAREALTKEYDAKYGPLYEERQAEKLWTTEVNTERRNIQYARDHWEYFKEFEKEIQALVFKDPHIDLHSAYRQIVVPALVKRAQGSEAEMRKKILADMNKKKKAANPPAHSTEPPRRPAADDDASPNREDDELTAVIKDQVRRKLRA